MNLIGVQIVENVFCFVLYKGAEIEEIPNTEFASLPECEENIRRLVNLELLDTASVPALLREAEKKMLDQELKKKRDRNRRLVLAEMAARQRRKNQRTPVFASLFPWGRS